MGKKLIVLALAAVGFATAPRSNAGTEVVEPQYAPQQTYNYAPPPPRPVYYPYPVPVSVVVYPAYRYSVPVRVYGYERRYRHGYYRSHHWH
jgi:hypothetical protein